MTIQNKILTVTIVVLLGGAGWYFYQPVTANSAAEPAPAARTAAIVSASSDSKAATSNAKTPDQLSPYSRCPETGTHPGDIQKNLTQQLLPLLQAGKTPAELLQYDLQGAIWSIAYAESVAQAMQIIGSGTLDIREASMLDMLAERLKQELSDSPADLARSLAADEDFQVFVPTGLGTWNGSSLVSPSLLFMQLGSKIPIKQFKQLIAGKTFSPLEIAVAMQSNLPEEHLLQLLAQGRDLQKFPAGYHNYQTRTPVWNLADIAAMLWQPAVLKALKHQGVVPSNIEGVVTGLDFALFTEPSRHLELEKNAELQKQLKQAQRDTVAYLLSEGYWAHGYQNDEGKWRFGNNFLNAIRFQAEDILALLPAGTPATVFRRAEVTPQPVPAGTALADWVQAQNQLNAAAAQVQQQCTAAKQQLLEQEALLSRDDIQDKIFTWRDGKPMAELALPFLHQQDPAWLAWHWQMGGARQLEADEKLKDELAEHLHDPAELTAYLQKTELDSGTTAWLLMEIVHQPDLLAAFNQRFAPRAPAYLYPVFSLQADTELKALLDAGYDLSLQDLYGRNLYMWAFRASPEAVLLMLHHGVSPFAQPLGPDALDLALEASYLQRELHPALPQILAQLTDAEPSHLARLQRLALYRPDLYQAILKIKPDLQIPPGTKPNELLSPPMF